MFLNRGLTGKEFMAIIGKERFEEIAKAYDLEIIEDPNSANPDQIKALLIGFATNANPDDLRNEKLSRLFQPEFSFSDYSNELSYWIKGILDQKKIENPELDESELLLSAFPQLRVNPKLKNDLAILSTRRTMNENFLERKNNTIIQGAIDDPSNRNKFASQLFLGYDLAYADLNDGACMSVIDNDGAERVYQVKKIAGERGFYCHVLVPLSADTDGNRDIKVLFRGTYDIDSLLMDLEARAPGGKVMAANRISLLRGLDRIVTEVQKNSSNNEKVSLTIAGHSLGGSLAEAFTSEVHQAIYHSKKWDQEPPTEEDLLRKFEELGLYHGNKAEQKKAARDVINKITDNKIHYEVELVKDLSSLAVDKMQSNKLYLSQDGTYRALISPGNFCEGGVAAETKGIIDWNTEISPGENGQLVWCSDHQGFNKNECIESILIHASKQGHIKPYMPQKGYLGLSALSQVNTMGINSARLLSREARVADGLIVLNANDNGVKQELREFKAGGDVVSQVSKRSIGAGLVTVDPQHVSVALLKKGKESNSLLRSLKAHMSYPFGTPSDSHLKFTYYDQTYSTQKELCKELSHVNLAMKLIMKIWRQVHKTPIVKDIVEKITTESIPRLFNGKDGANKSSDHYRREINTVIRGKPKQKK